VNNSAKVSGSAILTSDPNGVLVSCNPMEPQYDFIDQDLRNSLDHVHPKNTCRSWTGNRLATNSTELAISTFGQDLSFSIEHNESLEVSKLQSKRQMGSPMVIILLQLRTEVELLQEFLFIRCPETMELRSR